MDNVKNLTDLFGSYAASAVNTITFNSPTKKFNPGDPDKKENKLQVIGMKLLMTDDLESIADLKGLNPNTIIYITDYQKMEVLNIIDGAFNLLINNKCINNEITNKVLSFIMNLNNFYFYKDFIHDIEELCYELNLNSNLSKIIEVVWFIPYNRLDALYSEIVDEFNENKNKENGDNNEQQ